MNLRQVQDDRVRQLAETLKNNGLAASETEAIRMAESMTSTEAKVTRHFDENKNTSSMVRPVERAPRDPLTRNFATQPMQAQQSQPSQQTWEKEAMTQERPAPKPQSAPASIHSNGAIADAIGIVKQQFATPSSAPSQRIDFEAPEAQTLSEALQDEEEEVPAAPQAAQEAPMKQPVAIEDEAPAVVEQPQVRQPAPQAAHPFAVPAQQAQTVPPQQPVAAPQAAPEPKKDVSKYAESKVDLSSVFNFGKR